MYKDTAITKTLQSYCYARIFAPVSLPASSLTDTDPAMETAVLYLRVSTDQQADSGLGLAAQEKACRDTAERLGLPVSSVHVDAGVSGSTPVHKRPSLVAALADLSRGSVLIVAKRDRLSRDGYVTLATEREVQRIGARLVSAAGEGTGEGEEEISALILRRITDLIAEVEREMTRARTRAALAAKKERGERAGNVPFGFRLSTDGQTLLPCDRERDIAARVSDLRAAGCTYREIVDALNREGVRTRKGGRLYTRNVEVILRAVPSFS